MGAIKCKRCGGEIRSLNKLRKWCVDCRISLTNERARLRRKNYRKEKDNFEKTYELNKI